MGRVANSARSYSEPMADSYSTASPFALRCRVHFQDGGLGGQPPAHGRDDRVRRHRRNVSDSLFVDVGAPAHQSGKPQHIRLALRSTDALDTADESSEKSQARDVQLLAAGAVARQPFQLEPHGRLDRAERYAGAGWYVQNDQRA